MEVQEAVAEKTRTVLGTARLQSVSKLGLWPVKAHENGLDGGENRNGWERRGGIGSGGVETEVVSDPERVLERIIGHCQPLGAATARDLRKESEARSRSRQEEAW